MREIRCAHGRFAVYYGITPAYAGNTFPLSHFDRLLWDHPRVCGKYHIFYLLLFWFCGSPPRMREILSGSTTADCSTGITPAYAGNTKPIQLSERKRGDHPRVCGKYRTKGTVTGMLQGSPPRMREIRTPMIIAIRFFRITPAYAGNTLKNPNKIAIFPRLNSKNYLLFKINPLLHTILQNYNLMKETLTILSN